MIRIANIVGTRPNLVKIAALLAAQRLHPDVFESHLIHTGQHRDPAMSERLFHELELPPPGITLAPHGGGQAEQIGNMLVQLERVLRDLAPDLVLVVGDVNSTAAGALAASMLGIPVGHVEAGLRSFDQAMPEELNRTVVDAVSSMFFVSEASGVDNLLREGKPPTEIHHVGNVMIDTLVRFRQRAAQRDPVTAIGLPDDFAVLTLHRPSNVDRQVALGPLLRSIARIARHIPILFPVHPRTRDRLAASGLGRALASVPGLHLTDPLGYLDMLSLLQRARLVLTDSGGLQEETTYLGVPCLTLRENTERPATVSEGTNRIIGTRPERVEAEVERILNGDTPEARRPRLWDGRAAARVIQTILGTELHALRATQA